MMLATTERYTKSRMYENSWRDNHQIRIPWLNFLTAQSIPEETDVMDGPKRHHTDSDCSSSSIEDCYVVLEVQRPRSILAEQELNFAQINEDKHHVEYDQLAQSMTTEIPSTENAIEHQSKQMITHKKYAKVTQLLIHNDSPNFIKQKIDDSNPCLNHRCSITSLDSIETDTHISNSFQTPPDTTTVTQTSTFDRMCQEECGIKQQSVLPLCLDHKPTNLPKPSSFLRLIKKQTHTVRSEYYLSNNDIQTTEPSLLQMKYLDGRPTLVDFHALESFQKSQLPSHFISSRLNLPKISSTQDLSYGKRILNHIQTFFKSPSSRNTRQYWGL